MRPRCLHQHSGAEWDERRALSSAPRRAIAWSGWAVAPLKTPCLPVGAAELKLGRQAMFEDSTFESTGRIRTRSRSWMIASCAFNGSILLALVLIPLIYPQALPQMALASLMEAPPPPAPEPKPVARVEHAELVQPQMRNGQIFAPSGYSAPAPTSPTGRRHCRTSMLRPWTLDSSGPGRQQSIRQPEPTARWCAQQQGPGARFGTWWSREC